MSVSVHRALERLRIELMALARGTEHLGTIWVPPSAARFMVSGAMGATRTGYVMTNISPIQARLYGKKYWTTSPFILRYVDADKGTWDVTIAAATWTIAR